MSIKTLVEQAKAERQLAREQTLLTRYQAIAEMLIQSLGQETVKELNLEFRKRESSNVVFQWGAKEIKVSICGSKENRYVEFYGNYSNKKIDSVESLVKALVEFEDGGRQGTVGSADCSAFADGGSLSVLGYFVAASLHDGSSVDDAIIEAKDVVRRLYPEPTKAAYEHYSLAEVLAFQVPEDFKEFKEKVLDGFDDIPF